MTDQEIETPADHIRHASHAAHGEGDPKLTRDVALAVTVMAILAATIGSLQETESAHALGQKNEAVLLQARASDQWSFFQSKSVKKNSYQIAAEQASAAGRDPAPFADKAKRYAQDEDEVQAKATDLETQSHAKWEASTHHTHRQHTLTLAATLVHVAIAISSLAIFTSRRLPLHGALALAAGGIAVAAWAYLA
ncbi:MAG TPA: DUF4337 family protein [Magnetospirillaceae bacterium]|nr:DUF4337 family protein [Magnetospirillaceae bacterium]